MPQIQSAETCSALANGRPGILLFLRPLVFVMILRCGFFVRQRFGGDYAEVDVYNLVNIVVTFAIAAILTFRLRNVLLAIREGGTAIKCLVFYYVICASVGVLSPSPEYAIFRAIEYLACFCAVMIIVHGSTSFFNAERLALVWICLTLILEFAGHIRLIGWETLHTNRYTTTAAILFSYSLAELASAVGRRKQLLFISLAMGLFGVVLGASTGSNLAVVGGLIMLLLLSPRHRFYIIFAIPALLLVKSWGHIFEFVSSGKSVEQMITLFHRMGVWLDSWNLLIQRPVLGYGLNTATRYYKLLNSSHNAYLEALLGGGILGGGVLILGCLLILRDLFATARKHTDGSLGCCTAIIVYLINGMSTPTIGYIVTPHTIAFIFILALFAYHVRYRGEGACERPDILSAQLSQTLGPHVYGKTAEMFTESSQSF
jgi:O-antigen ligase